KLSAIEKNQDGDLQNIRRNQRNTERNYKDITVAFDRIKKLESTVYTLAAPAATPKARAAPAATPKPKDAHKAKTTHKDNASPSQQVTNALSDVEKKSAQLEVDRRALIEFNRINKALPEDKRYVWERVLESKEGDIRTMKFDRIADIRSLECLLSKRLLKTVVDNILVAEGGPRSTSTPVSGRSTGCSSRTVFSPRSAPTSRVASGPSTCGRKTPCSHLRPATGSSASSARTIRAGATSTLSPTLCGCRNKRWRRKRKRRRVAAAAAAAAVTAAAVTMTAAAATTMKVATT
ncbi:unnamed protein product, partial [Ectocarpus sp. 6 AP-2014]